MLISSIAVEGSAFAQKMIAALKQRFNREIILKYEVDPTIIGGAIIKAGDWVMDGSLSGRLTQLREILEV